MTGTDIATRNAREEALAQITNGFRSEAFQQQVALALPEGFKPERFARIAITAIQNNDDILRADPTTIVRAALRCAQDGLLPDGREAALVRRGDQAVYQPMIGGFRKIAAEYGWTLRTTAVYDGDDFDYTDEPPAIRHRQARVGVERGTLVAAYAIATHRDGRREQKVMFEPDIAPRRALATTSKVWEKWPAEMWAKTVGRDLFAELPFAETDRRAAALVAATTLDADTSTSLLYGAPDRPALIAPAAPADTPAPSNADAGPSTNEPAGADRAPVADAASPSAPATAPADELEQAAAEAAMFVPPGGVHGNAGRTLQQIHHLDSGGGTAWFRIALGKDGQPAPFRAALRAYTQVNMPDLYAELFPGHDDDVQF